MGFSYKPLFRLLIDHNMKETDLSKKLGLSSATLAKLNKGAPLSGESIAKLCTFFRCQVGDIVEIIWNDEQDTSVKKPVSASPPKKAPKHKNSGRRESNPRHKLGKLG